jgi:ribosomal-protein-alanine N-acetyltransferase
VVACYFSWGVAADAAALARLDAVGSPHPWSEAQFAKTLASERERVLVARPARLDETPLVAFCAFLVVADELHIHDVAVHPAWRRLGLARRLIETALRLGIKGGATQAFLEVRASNTAALGLYESLGFTRIDTRRDYYESPREDAVVMTLALRVRRGGAGGRGL